MHRQCFQWVSLVHALPTQLRFLFVVVAVVVVARYFYKTHLRTADHQRSCRWHSRAPKKIHFHLQHAREWTCRSAQQIFAI